MNKKDFFEVIIKIVGVWLLLRAIYSLPNILLCYLLTPHEFITETNRSLGNLLSWLHSLFVFLFGLALIFFGSYLTDKIFPGHTTQADTISLHDGKSAFVFCIRLIGIYITVEYFITFIRYIFVLVLISSHLYNTWIDVLTSLIGICIGLYLINGGKHLVKVIYRGNNASS